MYSCSDKNIANIILVIACFLRSRIDEKTYVKQLLRNRGYWESSSKYQFKFGSFVT